MDHVQGAIFDLDGTLFDSMWVWLQVDNTFLARRGIVATQDYFLALGQMDFTQAAAYTIARYGLDSTQEEMLAEWHTLAFDAYRSRVFLKPGARAYLAALRSAGVGLAVATSCMDTLAETALRANGIFDWFDTIVYTRQVPRDKMFPDIYLLAAQRLRAAPPHCIVFEDIPAYIETARDAGFRTCGVLDSHPAQHSDRLRQVSDRFILDFTELL